MKKVSECCAAPLATGVHIINMEGERNPTFTYCTRCKKDVREALEDIEEGEGRSV